MIKKCLLLFFIFILSASAFFGCKKIQKPIKSDTTLYEIGKTVILPNKSEITVQDVLYAPEYKFQTTTENVQNFPYVYLKKEKSGPRIIKIQKDGTTIDTLIDSIQSNTYSSAYIVEAGGDLTKTIASYVLDSKKDIIKPKKETDQFVFITVLVNNRSRKTITTKELKTFIELSDKSIVSFDSILADTILSNAFPSEIKTNEIASLRYVGLIPKNSKEIIINIEGKKFKWEVPGTKKTE